ncbi:fibronectin type III domain-containing protein [Lysobacter sp. A289]
MNLHPTLRSLLPTALAIGLLAACSPAPDSGATPEVTAVVAANAGAEAATPATAAVGAIRARMLQQLPAVDLADAGVDDVLPLLTPDELELLSTGFLRFTVDAPASIYVMQSPDSEAEPFWLEAQGFERTALDAVVDGDDTYSGWRKQVPAGSVDLGVPSIEGGIKPYFVLVGPAETGGAAPAVAALQPAAMSLGTATVGEPVYADEEDALDRIDPALDGLILVRTLEDREDEARLLGWFRNTPHPSSADADHVVLTWNGDPRTTQSVQWRTAPSSANSRLRYTVEGSDAAPVVIEADSHEIHTPDVANDPKVTRHTVALQGLQPGTAYHYAIGDGQAWGETRRFTTAPAQDEAFSFVYMGDAQNGLNTWGGLVRKARTAHPEAAFYVMAGDLVNWGERRDDWDLLFQNSGGVYDNRPLVPAIGNHEVDQGRAALYVDQFDLPRNGPTGVEPERVYAMEYGGAQFVVLDSNLPPEQQTEWLGQTLAASDAQWKFVVYHHPLYSTKPNDRGQPALKAAWAPVFEKHGVDLVLQGDDHAYLRTFPMKGDQVVSSPAEGPVYIHAVAGTKMYKQSDAPYIAKRFTDTSTYQVIDIDGGRLAYKAYDIQGNVLDEFTIEK